MVVIGLPATSDALVTHERAGSPLTWTVQAPQTPMPQPNLVPLRFSSSRSTQSSGISGSPSYCLGLPLMVNVIMKPLSALVAAVVQSDLFCRSPFQIGLS